MKKRTNSIERLTPSCKEGLSDKQVEDRKKNGFDNVSKSKVEKSFGRILFDNFFNSFNIVLICIALVFLFFVIYLNCTGNKEIADKHFGFSKFTFLIPVFLNSGIGTFQELRSKKIINKLKIVNEAKAIVIRDSKKTMVPVSEIVLDDILFLKSGSQVGVDAILQEGEIEVDESLLTGESDLIKKKKGDVLLAGSIVMVGSCCCRVDKVGNETYSSKLSEKVKSLARHKSELMTSIYGIIKVLSIVLLVVVAVVVSTLCVKIGRYGSDPTVWGSADADIHYSLTNAATWSKIMLTTGAFAIGVIPSGLILMTTLTLAVSIVTLAKQNTMVQELFSLESLSRVDTICLDKTGTLTDGSMKVERLIPFIDEVKIRDYIQYFNYASTDENQTASALKEAFGIKKIEFKQFVPFSSQKKLSSLLLEDKKELKLGAPDYLLDKTKKEYQIALEESKKGKRVIAFLLNENPIALFVLEDNIRSSSKETIHYFYENNVDVKIISGDNLETVQKIASFCGVKNTDKAISLENISLDDLRTKANEYTIFARVSPEQKQAIVESLQEKGKKVAMTGDGVNDILALRKANASITFSKATDAAKACSDVILLDNDFCHLKEVVTQGRRVVNNTQRTASLFLMKTFAIVILSILLIPFKRGQMWFSFENIYLMQTSVIAIGGFFMSLEKSKSPIRGSFKNNVFPKAFLSSVLMALAVLIPILLNRIPIAFQKNPIIAETNVSTLISIMTTIAGIVVLISMCFPITNYRWFVIGIVLLSVILLGAAFPTSYIGGKATTFTMFKSPDGNFFHAPIFHEFFQPWNASCIQNIYKDFASYMTMAIFFFTALPVYMLMIRKVNIKNKTVFDKKE